MTTQANKKCKIHVNVSTEDDPVLEYLWAERVSEDTVKVVSIPVFSAEVAYQDVVRVNEDGEVVEVLQRRTRTRHASCDGARGRQDAERQYQAICDHLRPFDIECDWARPGRLRMAVPEDVTDDRLLELCSQCPVPLTLPPQ
jgi:hypothetical protein